MLHFDLLASPACDWSPQCVGHLGATGSGTDGSQTCRKCTTAPGMLHHPEIDAGLESRMATRSLGMCSGIDCKRALDAS